MNEALRLAPQVVAAAGVTFTGYAITTVFIIGLMLWALLQVKSGLKDRVFKNPWTGRGEQLFLFLESFALGIIGPHGRKYLPMLATFWLFIFFANLVALFLPYSPTADLSSNLGMALVAVAYVQWEGIRANGFFGHLKHFSGPKLTGALVAVSGMIFMIEIISEAMKIISLSLRLYGNIYGGHQVVENLNHLGHLSIGGTHVLIPIGAFLLPVKLLTVIVQALVFTLLLSVYIGLVTHHEEEGPKEMHPTEGEPQALEPAHA